MRLLSEELIKPMESLKNQKIPFIYGEEFTVNRSFILLLLEHGSGVLVSNKSDWS